MPRLFVNVDHVATVRQARRGSRPDPVLLAQVAEEAGADGITMHLREDRRHVQDHDIKRHLARSSKPFNFELGCDPEILQLCADLAPAIATLVPERRAEVTTEGGLDLLNHGQQIAKASALLRRSGIKVSHFIDPTTESVRRALDCGAEAIELHTGPYVHAAEGTDRARQIEALREAAAFALDLGLEVNAGHGLDYDNVAPVAAIKGLADLNIGHAIVAHALQVGMKEAVEEMLSILRHAEG